MALLSFLFFLCHRFSNLPPRGITFRGVLRGQAVDKHKGEDYHIVGAEMCRLFLYDKRHEKIMENRENPLGICKRFVTPCVLC